MLVFFSVVVVVGEFVVWVICLEIKSVVDSVNVFCLIIEMFFFEFY